MPVRCRLCNEQIHSRNATNIFKGKHRAILESIGTITGLKLLDRPQMPQHICASCHLDLQHLTMFRERCIKTQEMFLKLVDRAIVDPLNTNLQMVTASTRGQAAKEALPVEVPCDSLLREMLPASPILELKSESDLDRNLEPYLDSKPKTNLLPMSQSDYSRKKAKRRRTPLVQNLVCDKCGKCFKDSSNLRLHLVRHAGVKNFECPQCGDKFFSQHLLNLHDRVRHQGEKPYKCKFCGLQFLTSTARCRHERIRHIRTLSFKCKYCDKGFIVQSDLKKHEYLHSGERPHRCEICDIGFPRRTNLKLHFRSKSHQKRADAVRQGNEIESVDDDFDKLIEEDENYLTDSLIEECLE